jgi:hypothetical protein
LLLLVRYCAFFDCVHCLDDFDVDLDTVGSYPFSSLYSRRMCY